MKRFAFFCLIFFSCPIFAQWATITPEGEEFYDRLLSDETLNKYLLQDINLTVQERNPQLNEDKKKEISLRTLEKIKEQINPEMVKEYSWSCVSKLEEKEKNNMSNACVKDLWSSMASSIPYILSEVEAEYIPCPTDKPLRGHNGCHSCDELETITMYHPEDCVKLCPDRYRDRYECLFATKSCPKTTPLKRVGRLVILGQNFEKGEPDCYSCDEPKNLRVSNCSDCPNRYLSEDGYNDCVLRICPNDTPLQSRLTEECFSCDDPRDLDVKNCSVCPGRHGDRWACHPCPADKPLLYEGQCYSCDDTTPVKVVGCTNICPNRDIKRVNDDFFCVPKDWTCPDDKPLKSEFYGECFSCDELDGLSVENCSVCPNRYLKHIAGGGNLHLCVQRECPSGTVLSSERGYCVPCDSEREVIYKTTEEDCLQCPNRVYDKLNKWCYIKNWKCPDDKPLKGDEYKRCYSCDEPGWITTSNCDVCPNRYWRTNEFGPARCVLKNCPSDRPFRSKEGECVSCDYDGNIPGLSKEECSACQGRIYTEDGDCTTCEGLSNSTYMGVSKQECEHCLPKFYKWVGISKEECERCERKWVDDSCKFVSIYEKGV